MIAILFTLGCVVALYLIFDNLEELHAQTKLKSLHREDER